MGKKAQSRVPSSISSARRLACAAAVASSLALGGTAWAANGTWSGTAGDGLWQTAGNWDNVPGDVGTTTNTDVATFNGLLPQTTVTIDAGRNIGSITLDPDVNIATGTWVVVGASPNGGNPLVLSNGGTIQLTNVAFAGTDTRSTVINSPLVLAGATYSIINNSGDSTNTLGALRIFGNVSAGTSGISTLTLDGDHGTAASSRAEFYGAINDGLSGGTMSLVKNGPGMWKMAQSSSAPNTYSGATIINAGTLRVVATSGFDALGGLSANSDYTVNSTGTLQVSVTGATARSVTVNAGGTFSVSDQAANVVNLKSESGPALTLNYAGAVGSSVSVPINFTGTTPGEGGIRLVSDGATAPVDLGGTTSPFNLGSVKRTIEVGGTSGTGGYNLRFRGPVSGGSGSGGIIKTGTGVLRLDAASNFSGNVDVREGTFRLNGDNFLQGNVSITLKPNAALATSTRSSQHINLNTNAGPALLYDFTGATNTAAVTPVNALLNLTGSVANEGGISVTAGPSMGPIDLNDTTTALDIGSVVRTFDIAHGNPSNSYDLRLRPPVTGGGVNGGILKVGNGILRFDNANSTFTGSLEVRDGQAVFSQNSNLTGVNVLVSGGDLHVNGGFSPTFAGVVVTKGGLSGSNSTSTLKAPTYAFNVGASDTATTSNVILADGTVSATLTKTGAGSATLNGGLAYTGSTSVSGGTLTLGTNLTSSASVSVSGSGSALQLTGVNNATNPTRVIKTGALSITGGAKVDISNGKIITASAVGTWTGATYSSVTGYVASGRSGSTWTGSGIVTSQSAAIGSNYTSIGVAKASDVRPNAATATELWGGQTITGTDTLVMYTYGGDANLDGKINIDDYVKIDSGIASGLTGWSNGDFNYDGKVNIDDYTTVIDANIGIQNGFVFPTAGGLSGEGSGVTAVPEPGTISMLGLLSGLLHRKRRRRPRA